MRFIQLFIFVIFILASSTQARAGDLAVRIINETENTINITNLFVKDKRSVLEMTNEGDCDFEGAYMKEVRKDAVHRCNMRGMTKKQRSISVYVVCDPSNSTDRGNTTEIVFPRNRGWFGRKHLKNNNQLYTLKIKESDCQ